MGIDFAPTAVARTRALGVAAQVAMFSGFSHEPFDLVSVHYGGIRATPEEVEKLERLVAPRGTLLFVHHDITLARRERHLAEGAGAHHRTDVVLVAKRVG